MILEKSKQTILQLLVDIYQVVGVGVSSLLLIFQSRSYIRPRESTPSQFSLPSTNFIKIYNSILIINANPLETPYTQKHLNVANLLKENRREVYCEISYFSERERERERESLLTGLLELIILTR